MSGFSTMSGGDTSRVCLIGLDGTPHSLLLRLIQEGIVPNIAEIARQGTLRSMTSVHPWVSSVAWTTLSTGVNPAKHNIFGFIDRVPNTHQVFIPLNTHRGSPTIWERLSDAGKRSVIVNNPLSYPVKPLNGIEIAGFLAPKLDFRSVYPSSLLPQLEKMGYRIDTDAHLARKSRDEGMADILDVLEKRLELLFQLLRDSQWDYFQFVIMETDRLHHFFFRQMEDGDPIWKPVFYDMYRRIDSAIARVRELLRPEDTLILVSDHGFCSIRKEVYLNAALAEAGYLYYNGDPTTVRGPKLEIVAPNSKAFVIDPGRIVINLKGREKNGSVSPSDYERIRSELVEWAETLTDPDTGNRVIERAYRREEIYSGPFLENAADLILSPVNGYDPKGALWRPTIFHKDEMMVGMHTYDDAMLCILRPDVVTQAGVTLEDIAPTVLQLLGAPIAPELDGRSLVQ